MHGRLSLLDQSLIHPTLCIFADICDFVLSLGEKEAKASDTWG